MKVTYLGHSGFLAETANAYYLFDYIRGEVQKPEDGKPLYVFVSHAHGDHFSLKIFESRKLPRADGYILGNDIRKKFQQRRPSWLVKYEDRIFWAEPGKPLLLPVCRVLPLKSTDQGVAYLAEEEKVSLFHAGDLNWWHWEGETPAWNRNMEVNYKREIGRLKDRRITAAFVPLDPRMEDSYWLGMEYFLRTVSADAVFPMHFWENYGVIDRYLTEHGGQNRIRKIEREGQEYEI